MIMMMMGWLADSLFHEGMSVLDEKTDLRDDFRSFLGIHGSVDTTLEPIPLIVTVRHLEKIFMDRSQKFTTAELMQISETFPRLSSTDLPIPESTTVHAKHPSLASSSVVRLHDFEPFHLLGTSSIEDIVRGIFTCRSFPNQRSPEMSTDEETSFLQAKTVCPEL